MNSALFHMKKTLVILILFLSMSEFSQDERAAEMHYSQEARAVFQGTRKLDMEDLFVRMRPYPKSFKLIESARNTKFFSLAFSTAGALPLGYVLITRIAFNEFSWPVLATGIGLVGASIPLHFRYKKQLQRSVVSFNRKVKTTTFLESKTTLSLCVSGTGIGLQLNF